MTEIEPTDRRTLPQWRDRPVPWITRWSGEIVRVPYSIEATPEGLRFVYPDGKENRDERNILWQREGINRKGEPRFAEVNTYRQRTAMKRRRCQICGRKIRESTIRWLMPLKEEYGGIQWEDDDTALTTSAPTCSACIPLALELCPHLKTHGYQIVRVLKYSLWGVFGETIIEGRRTQTFIGFDKDYGPDFGLGLVFAKQSIARLDVFRVEEVGVGAEIVRMPRAATDV